MLTCLAAESIAPDADGDALVARRVSRSPSSTPSASRRTCATASGSPSRSSPTRWSTADAPSRARRRCPPTEAQPLAKQSLRFLYRILFLLYAEASPRARRAAGRRAGVRPGLQPGPAARAGPGRAGHPAGPGRHPPVRLARRAVPPGRPGHAPSDAGRRATTDGSAFDEGLTFNALRADLFRPGATAHIDEVGLGNAAAAAGAPPPAAEQGEAGPRPRLHLLRRARASTSSARCTRA